MSARRQVTRSVTLPAPPRQVRQVLAEPDALARWLGLDAGPRVLHVDSDGCLELWWCADGSAGAVSVVRVVLEPDGEGSRVTVTETVLGDHAGPLPADLELPGGGAAAEPTASALTGAPRR